MSASPEVIAARKLNQAKYALEDFDDGVSDFFKVAVIYGVLALAMGLSILLNADNFYHLMYSLVGMLIFLGASRQNFLRQSNLVVMTIVVVLLLATEAIALGLPDLLVPFMNLQEWRGAPILLNYLTPFAYWGIKSLALFYLLRVWLFRAKVYAQPEDLLRKAAGNRLI